MSPVMADKVQNGASTAKIWGFLARCAAGGTMKPMPRSSCCHRCHKPKYRRVAKPYFGFLQLRSRRVSFALRAPGLKGVDSEFQTLRLDFFGLIESPRLGEKWPGP